MLALYDLMHEISSRLWVILKLEMVDLGYLEMIMDFATILDSSKVIKKKKE